MSAVLEHKKVADLSTAQLYQAYERRLVQEGLTQLDAGQGVEVTPAYFDDLRQLARDTSAQSK